MKRPRTLFIDIETAPVLAAVFPPLNETNVIWVERNTYIYGFACQWLGEREIKSYFLPDYKLFKKKIHSDRAVCETLHQYLSEAQICIGHNASRFDLKLIRTRLLINNFPPPPPVKVVDTLTLTRGTFRHDSNKLDALSRATGIGAKLPHTGKDLWRDCYHGDEAAFRKMADYCRQDVRLLAAYWERTKSWFPTHADFRPYTGAQDCCPTCLSNNVHRRGVIVRSTRVYQQFQCRDCSKWFYGRLENHYAQKIKNKAA